MADEGKVSLEWAIPDGEDSHLYELQQSRRVDFSITHTRYEGLDRATYVSGLPEGDFYYRVRSLGNDNQPGPWSDTVLVKVEYVSLKLVFLLVSIGLVVFAATVVTVLIGHRRTSNTQRIQT